jgi:hypothetical protein
LDVPAAGYQVTRSCGLTPARPDATEAKMAEDDLLSQMLHAWREDIESVPFPQFNELLIPRQQVRTRRSPSASAARVTNATRRTDA